MKDRINKVLKEKGWKPARLAREIGVSAPWLSKRIGRGKSTAKLTCEDVDLICGGLGIELSDLFPPKLKYDISKMTFEEFVSRIVENKIDEYFEKNGLKKSEN